MLDFVLRPLRYVLGVGGSEVSKPLDEAEHELVDAVRAIQRASDSIDHHVEVIEGLATSVGPLTDSVNQLTATMADLVALLGPVAGAEHGVQRAEHLLHRRRHEPEPGSEPGTPEA